MASPPFSSFHLVKFCTFEAIPPHEMLASERQVWFVQHLWHSRLTGRVILGRTFQAGEHQVIFHSSNLLRLFDWCHLFTIFASCAYMNRAKSTCYLIWLSAFLHNTLFITCPTELPFPIFSVSWAIFAPFLHLFLYSLPNTSSDVPSKDIYYILYILKNTI